MGIRYLNKYLVEHCQECIEKKHMKDLYGKTIVVDISIYLYKYLMSDTLVENMYLMLSLFDSHHITPIFIFDGKPPDEKKDVLNKRFGDKMKAEEECKKLKAKMDEVESEEEKSALLENIQSLKKKCVFLRKEDKQKVKELIHNYGYTYYTANGEADELCAAFVRSKKAWACLSEDMDMFVYGIPRVLRYISLLKNTFVFYDTHKILKRIGISSQDFMELCIMTGSDYASQDTTDIYTLFKIYHKYISSDLSKNLSFRKWLKENENKLDVKCMDDDTFSNVRNMFVRDCDQNNKIIKNCVCCRQSPNYDSIKKILEEDGFVYPIEVEC